MRESNIWRPVKRPTLFMLLTYLNRSVSTKLATWKFCFYSLRLSFITKQDHDLLWNSQWSPNVISCKCIFEFLLKPDEQITSAVSATASSFCWNWKSSLPAMDPETGGQAFVCSHLSPICFSLCCLTALSRRQLVPNTARQTPHCYSLQEQWHPQKGSYRRWWGVFAQTKQPNKLMLTFTASLGSFKKIYWQHKPCSH